MLHFRRCYEGNVRATWFLKMILVLLSASKRSFILIASLSETSPRQELVCFLISLLIVPCYWHLLFFWYCCLLYLLFSLASRTLCFLLFAMNFSSCPVEVSTASLFFPCCPQVVPISPYPQRISASLVFTTGPASADQGCRDSPSMNYASGTYQGLLPALFPLTLLRL